VEQRLYDRDSQRIEQRLARPRTSK
jgi:hypothetical protein